jgi:hypothetical protein
MPPDLVIATTPYQTYPGGVIAVRCAEWVAGGGSGTVVSDPLAHDGEAVADSQQVSNIRTAATTAYDAATETLELVACPLRAGQDYFPFISYRIEGETDLTDTDLLKVNTNEALNSGVILGINVGTNRSFVSVTSPPLPHYRQTLSMAGWTPATDNPDIIVKVAAETGTTYEIFIDQITFIPNLDTQVFEWADPNLTTTIVDGADGGDANGIFTWTPYQASETDSGVGDFQQKADFASAEWFERVVPDDGLALIDSSEPVSVQVYGMHGAGFRGIRTWAEDTFDNRTTSSTPTPHFEFGVDPTGYGYAVDGSVNSNMYVDGAGNGVFKVHSGTGTLRADWGNAATGASVALNQGRRLNLYDQWSWTGLVTFTDDASMTSSNNVQLRFQPMKQTAGPDVEAGFITVFLHLNTWQVTFPDGSTSASNAIAWFVQGAQLGWRIELERYVVRYKIWDASGAEPGTWDYEDFVSISGVGGGFSNDYDYDDFVNRSARITERFDNLRVQLAVIDNIPVMTFPLQIDLNYMQVTHDPGGDPGDIYAEFLAPEANSWGNIQVPYGACYFVHWGTGSPTGQDGFGDWYLDYSSKVWDDEGVAEIQRAETVQWVMFRSAYWLIPMNWRSSDREKRRVLVGDR